MTTAIWWIRRDLRIHDNQALNAALKNHQLIIPVFVLDDKLLASRYSSDRRLSFMLSSLRDLDHELQIKGSRLIVRRASPESALTQILQESGAESIYAEADHSSYARERDQRVQQILPLHLAGSSSIIPPGKVMKSDSSPYTVFTPFSKAWREVLEDAAGGLLPAPKMIATPSNLASDTLPESITKIEQSIFAPGESAGRARLNAFFDGGGAAKIYRYTEGRNMLDQEGTAMISPYLRFGMLSPREVAYRAIGAIQGAPNPKARESAELWLNEIIWREFYIHILYHYPHVRTENFRLSRITWENDESNFSAWKDGQTGYPVVDAAMRQLIETGWMHNRARMIVASFLIKDLLIDWRWGEAWFMQQLIDGDPAANNGGWQWTAGTGTDAALYFRIFNPITQSKKFDPHGVFIRRWLPELTRIPTEFIHEPWKMPVELQKQFKCLIGKDYPYPIIDHAWARQRALDVYDKAKD